MTGPGKMNWRYVIHLPGLVLECGERLPFLDGEIVALSHDEWQAIDEVSPAPVDFADCKPAFFMGEKAGLRSSFMGPDSSTIKFILERRQQLYRAFVLSCGLYFLPDFKLSCTYVRGDWEERGLLYFVGASGRDWILTGQYRPGRHTLTPDMLAMAAAVLDDLAACEALLEPSGVEAALQSLAVASLPDAYATINGESERLLPFLSAVSAMENLLISQNGSAESITEQFARGASVLVSQDKDCMERFLPKFRNIYRLRSELLHSRRAANTLAADEIGLILLGTFLLPVGLRRIIAILASANKLVDLPRYLAAAAVDAGLMDKIPPLVVPGADE